MSRYEIYIDGKEVALGWDAGLCTYFAQVAADSGRDCESDELLLWAGTTPGEIPNVQQLGNVIREQLVEIPSDVVEALERDKREEPAGSAVLDAVTKKNPQ